MSQNPAHLSSLPVPGTSEADPQEPSRVVSSPAMTVQPLAQTHGLLLDRMLEIGPPSSQRGPLGRLLDRLRGRRPHRRYP